MGPEAVHRKLGLNNPKPGILVLAEDGSIKTVSLKDRICYDLGDESYIVNPNPGLSVNVTPKSNNDIILVKAKIPVDIEVESVATIKGVISTGFKSKRDYASICGVWIATESLSLSISPKLSMQDKLKSYLGLITVRHTAGRNITNSVANLVNIHKEVHLKPGMEHIYIYLYSNTMWYDIKKDDTWGVASIWFESIKKSVIEF